MENQSPPSHATHPKLLTTKPEAGDTKYEISWKTVYFNQVLRETYLVDEDEKKKALRKEFDAFQRLQGKSFKQMTTRISLIILMCENNDIEISNEEKVTTLLHRIGSQM